MKAVPSVEILAIKLDDKLKFNIRDSKICDSEANEFNDMTSWKNFMTFHAKKTLIITKFQLLTYSDCFLPSKFLNIIKNLQKTANIFTWWHERKCEQLLNKTGRSSVIYIYIYIYIYIIHILLIRFEWKDVICMLLRVSCCCIHQA